MAREHAQVNMGIWQDDDWRSVPPAAQHLYLVLWTHPGLSYCGVLDWRPGRLSALAGGWLKEDVIEAADCLRARHFIVVDEDTEECLIRSWVRWDGLMKQPRIAVSYANAYAAVASNAIRKVLIHELKKLHELDPNLGGFAKPQVQHMLTLDSISAKDLPPVSDPFGDGFPHRFGHRLGEQLPKVSGSTSVPPTPAPAPAPISPPPLVDTAGDDPPAPAASVARKRATRMTDDWLPSPTVRAEMQAECPSVNFRTEHKKFIDHWMSKGGRDAAKLDWDRAWRNWIRNAAERTPTMHGHIQPAPAYVETPAPDPSKLPWRPAVASA